MIEGEIAALLSSPCALIVGTVDAAGVPEAARAFGLVVLDGGSRLRILVPASATTVIQNLETTGAIAVTGTVVTSFASVQVKGHAVTVEPETDDDRTLADAYTTGFIRAVHDADGSPVELLERLRPRARVAVVMTVEAMFDQTPGPQAGRSLQPTNP